MIPAVNTCQSLAAECEFTLKGPDVEFTGVSTDTRTLKPGDLFVALRGENFDGHEYVAEALRSGAVAALVESDTGVKIPQLLVRNSRLAYGEIAKKSRQRFAGKVVGLTGSCGKTTGYGY